MRLLLPTLVFAVIPSLGFTQDIPDKAVQAAYCEGVIMGQIKYLQNLPPLDCSNSPLDQSLCESIKEDSDLNKVRNRYVKIYNYVELYSRDNTTRFNLNNFTLTGIGDFNDYIATGNRAFPKCFSIENKEKHVECLKSNNLNSEKIVKCSKFDPTDF